MRGHRSGRAIVGIIALVVMLGACAAPTPTPTPKPPKPVATEYVLHPEFVPSEVLSAGYGSGTRAPVSMPGDLCAISSDKTVAVTTIIGVGGAKSVSAYDTTTGISLWSMADTTCRAALIDSDSFIGRDGSDSPAAVSRFEIKTGNKIVSYDAPDLPYNSTRKANTDVVLTEDASTDTLTIFDTAGGALLWQMSTRSPIGKRTCDLAPVAGSPVICTLSDRSTEFYDARTGDKWSVTAPSMAAVEFARDGVIIADRATAGADVSATIYDFAGKKLQVIDTWPGAVGVPEEPRATFAAEDYFHDTAGKIALANGAVTERVQSSSTISDVAGTQTLILVSSVGGLSLAYWEPNEKKPDQGGVWLVLAESGEVTARVPSTMGTTVSLRFGLLVGKGPSIDGSETGTTTLYMPKG